MENASIFHDNIQCGNISEHNIWQVSFK